ncbi:MAG: cytochrome C [Planctomycetes bacterium]|nr:cytochrome C [Planctomycetota bacterium]
MKKMVLLTALAVLYGSMPAMAMHQGTNCDSCHTPHNADTTVTGAPLWDSSQVTITTTSFTTYGSGTLDATMDAANGIDGSTRLCMSCHDGSQGAPSLGSNDLSHVHPVSFVYDAQLAIDDGGLKDPSSALSGVTTSGTIQDDLLSGDAGNKKMQCASCHDIHSTGTSDKYLVKSNTNSALCLTCHNK